MIYTENLELPVVEDNDTSLNFVTQGNEIANKVEEKLGTYDDTVEALNGLTQTVSDMGVELDAFEDTTTDSLTEINTALDGVSNDLESLRTRVTKLESGVIKSNILDDTKKIDYYAVNFNGVARFNPSDPLQSNVAIDSEPLNTPLDLHNGDKVQILAVTPVTGRGVVTVNTGAIISMPNVGVLVKYCGFVQTPTTNGLRIEIDMTNQYAISEVATNQQIGISVLVAVEREI